MRKSREEAAQTREAIVQAAADLIRSQGLAEASVANVMAAAGLTHGGFYRHFRNRDQLLCEAVALAGASSVRAIAHNLEAGGLAQAAAIYLSAAHRDAVAPICPFAAAGSELARASAETRNAATETLKALFSTLAAANPTPGIEARGDAIARLATMIGALTLSRIVSDTALSDEILHEAQARTAA